MLYMVYHCHIMNGDVSRGEKVPLGTKERVHATGQWNCGCIGHCLTEIYCKTDFYMMMVTIMGVGTGKCECSSIDSRRSGATTTAVSTVLLNNERHKGSW